MYNRTLISKVSCK